MPGFQFSGCQEPWFWGRRATADLDRIVADAVRHLILNLNCPQLLQPPRDRGHAAKIGFLK
ncbi:hypothetical protein [Rubidibacter lacunae]|uniref:hypothetical protein n=1 Tax=Rubidibacter lacunae TaxID=582514 RepID=UPI0005917870|nr:hypothetical protein [Rubidibacter lacunae]